MTAAAEVLASGRIPEPTVMLGRRIARITGDDSDEAALAASLALNALGNGSVLVDLAEPDSALPVVEEEDATALSWPDSARWAAALAASPITMGDAAPLHLSGTRVFLHRYWRAEGRIAENLLGRLPGEDGPPTATQEFRADDLDEQQRAAVESALAGRLTILTGGPGTGKTFTIARLLDALVQSAAGDPPTIALAAPTGKAAARMKEAIAEHSGADIAASTVHRLLQPVPGDFGRFRRNRSDPLPHDVVIVDEASMISVALLDALMDAVRPDARLIMVGDPDQLASVEAGNALADIVDSGAIPVTRLQVNHRNPGNIHELADAVRLGDRVRVESLLRDPDRPDLYWAEDSARVPERVSEWIARWGSDLRTAAQQGDINRSLAAVNGLRVLCAHRRGPAGVSSWAPAVMGRFGAAPGKWPIGQPVMITKNHVVPGLYNGDCGVVVRTDDGPWVAFGEDVRVAPDRLGSHFQTAYALTAHKAQGSQFDRVVLVLPESGSRILMRDLVYTAITRARREVAILGSAGSLRAALGRGVGRATGLAQRVYAVSHKGRWNSVEDPQ